MRWLIAGTLAYFAYGSFGVAWDDYRHYRTLALPGSKWALFMGGLLMVEALCLFAGWGI